MATRPLLALAAVLVVLLFMAFNHRAPRPQDHVLNMPSQDHLVQSWYASPSQANASPAPAFADATTTNPSTSVPTFMPTQSCSLQRRHNCLVSVVIPYCQRINTTLNAVDSITRQTHRNWELILVADDVTVTNSCALPVETMRSLVARENVGDHRVLVVSAQQECASCPHGYKAPGFTRNIGMNLARGHFIAFLDDDDLALETRLQVQVAALLREPAYKLVFSEAFAMTKTKFFRGRFPSRDTFVRLNATRKVIGRLQFDLVVRDVTIPHLIKFHSLAPVRQLDETVPLALMRQHNVIITSTVMLSANFLRANHLRFNPMHTAGVEDVKFWLEILERSKQPARYIAMPLGVYDLEEHGRANLLMDDDDDTAQMSDVAGAAECSRANLKACLVSVVTLFCKQINATLNAVESITRQTWTNWEMILIMDDLSADKSPCAVSLDEMVLLVSRERGHRHRILVESAREQCPDCPLHRVDALGSAAWNVGIQRATGDFLALLGEEDLMMPLRLERQIRDLATSNSKLTFGESLGLQHQTRYHNQGFIRFNASSEAHDLKRVVSDLTLGHLIRSHAWSEKQPIPLLITHQLLIKHNVVTTSTVMANLTFLKSQGLLFDPAKSDADLWLRVLAHSGQPIVFDPQPLGFTDLERAALFTAD